ncbi:MAG: GAF domain-containing protein, partial [Candidatus Heimdallarchaeota archaeon]|nr:GAF domain-containing protein [Candidatus Heimdallarchaeota archaeon]MCK5048334.1 GAF domain-containing protein [Candidatus Heimdallarchaeota archaeon]
MNDNLPQTNRFQKNILLVNDRRELSALVKNYFEEETRLLNFAIVQTVEEVTHTKMYDLIVIYLTEKQNSTIDFIASLRAGRNATPLLLISTTSTNQELSLLEIGFGEIFYLAMNENRADHLTDLKEIFSKLVPEGIDIDKAISLQYKNEDWSIPTLSINDLIRMISKNFVNLAPTKIDEEINNTLRIIGEYVGAEVSYVNLFSDNQTKFFNSHEWTAKNVSSQSANFYGMTTEFPWGFSKTLKGEIVQVSDTNDMPDEAKIDQQKIREIGGKAYISAPLERQGKIIGYVGFSLRKQTRIWSDFDIDLLRTVGKLISSALEQKKAHYRMRYRHELDNMILTLSNNFINLPVDDIDQGINHALRNIANFIEVDVGILALFTSDLERISIEYTWSNNTEILENYPSNVRLSDYPQILEYISQSQDFYFSNISQIPKELIAGREIIEKAGLKSIASIPLMYSDRILGFLTFA